MPPCSLLFSKEAVAPVVAPYYFRYWILSIFGIAVDPCSLLFLRVALYSFLFLIAVAPSYFRKQQWLHLVAPYYYREQQWLLLVFESSLQFSRLAVDPYDIESSSGSLRH